MSDGSLPAGFTVDSADDDSPGSDTLPKGFKIDPGSDDDAPMIRSAPQMPTNAQLTDPNASNEDIGAMARQTGDALAAGNGPAETGPGIVDAADTAVALGSGALVGGVGGGVAGLAARIKASFTGDKTPDEAAADAHKWVDQYVYKPQTEGGKAAVNAVGNAINYVTAPYKAEEQSAETALGPTAGGLLHTVVGTAGDVLNATPAIGAASSAFDLAKSGIAGEASSLKVPGDSSMPASGTPQSAESVLANAAAQSKGNMGAAVAAPSLEGVSPGLKQAIASATNPNMEAATRQINADTLPMPDGMSPAPLRKGQAMRDDQQISDEKNMRADPDTQGLLAKSITDQNDTMGASMGEIRQRATPDIVQRSTAEQGQANVDAIKTQDNAAVTGTRQKYKALSNAAGGVMPIDTGATIAGIKSALSEKLLVRTAANDPAISEVMDSLSSGQPMPFESFHNALSNLAEVQRNKGSPAAAATVVRNALESMPLTPEFANLKGLRDVASSAAKARFDTIEQNPAYDAAVNDNVPKTQNGLHVIGVPSPLADTFMERYYLGNGPSASRAYVSRIQSIMQDNPDFSQSIEASALNKLRDAAKLDQYDSGNFASASFRNAHNALAPKADVLVSPQTADNLRRLRQYSDDVSYEGKASSVNRPNTALTLQRHGAMYPPPDTMGAQLADMGTDLVAAHAGAVGYAAKKIGSAWWKGKQAEKFTQSIKDAKFKFAQDATAPGAGIDTPAAPITARAAGGRVDHKALADQLFTRWKQAQKESDKNTEPLLKFPDATIIKALRIAQAQPLT
jgi:hypothetical protein